MSLWVHVTVGSGSVVAMSLWGPCHSGQQVSGGHVTVSNRPLVAMSLWGYVTVGSVIDSKLFVHQIPLKILGARDMLFHKLCWPKLNLNYYTV